jgi:hypothetical protein
MPLLLPHDGPRAFAGVEQAQGAVEGVNPAVRQIENLDAAIGV